MLSGVKMVPRGSTATNVLQPSVSLPGVVTQGCCTTSAEPRRRAGSRSSMPCSRSCSGWGRLVGTATSVVEMSWNVWKSDLCAGYGYSPTTMRYSVMPAAHTSSLSAYCVRPSAATSGGWNAGAPMPSASRSVVAVPKSDRHRCVLSTSIRLSGLMSRW